MTPHTATGAGALREGRFGATILDSERYQLTCYRYVELNPVRTGMVSNPAEYPWSGYRENAVGGAGLLKPHEWYYRSDDVEAQRMEVYRNLYESHMPKRSIEEIRGSTNKGWVFGNDQFRKKTETMTKRRAVPGARRDG